MEPRHVGGNLVASGMKVAVVASRFNDFIVSRLIGGALDAFERHGGDPAAVTVYRVPGAFELPLTVKRIAQTKRFDAIVCLGAVIRGATPHFDFVAGEAFKGLSHVALDTGVPIAVGIVTADSLDQAIDRAGAKSGNKGFEAAVTAIEMVNLLRAIEE